MTKYEEIKSLDGSRKTAVNAVNRLMWIYNQEELDKAVYGAIKAVIELYDNASTIVTKRERGENAEIHQ